VTDAMVQLHGVRIAGLSRLKYDPDVSGANMKRTSHLAIATITICLLATATQAQSSDLRLSFRVSFPFTVGNTTLAAGEYEVTQPARFVLELRKLHGQTPIFQNVRRAHSRNKADGRMRIIFHRYGSEYFLASVSDGSWQLTYDLRRSSKEERLAGKNRLLQPQVVSVLTDGTVEMANIGQ
jgi:hypothetical protein